MLSRLLHERSVTSRGRGPSQGLAEQLEGGELGRHTARMARIRACPHLSTGCSSAMNDCFIISLAL